MQQTSFYRRVRVYIHTHTHTCHGQIANYHKRRNKKILFAPGNDNKIESQCNSITIIPSFSKLYIYFICIWCIVVVVVASIIAIIVIITIIIIIIECKVTEPMLQFQIDLLKYAHTHMWIMYIYSSTIILYETVFRLFLPKYSFSFVHPFSFFLSLSLPSACLLSVHWLLLLQMSCRILLLLSLLLSHIVENGKFAPLLYKHSHTHEYECTCIGDMEDSHALRNKQ